MKPSLKFRNFLLLLAACLPLFTLAHAEITSIRSLEDAAKIPEIIEAKTRVTVEENQCPSGLKFTHWIDVRFNGLDKLFTGYNGFTVQERKPEQCQYQAHQIRTNRDQPHLVYITSKNELPEDIQGFMKSGPYLMLDGGEAWNYFANHTEANQKTVCDQLIICERQISKSASEVCVHERYIHNLGGWDKVTCYFDLAKNGE